MSNTLELDPLFRDGAVLQRNRAVAVWGIARPSARIAATLTRAGACGGAGTSNGDCASSYADASGSWRVTLPAHPAGGPYELRVESDGESVETHDLLFGDVWLLGGQSNMWLWMDRVAARYPGELDRARDGSIRFFLVPQEADFTGPRTRTAGGTWLVEGRDDVSGVSAAGFFFAKHLREDAGVDVPLGFVQAAIGGTPIEPWIAEPWLRRLDLIPDDFDRWREPGYAGRLESEADDRFGQFVRDADSADLGLAEHWEDPRYDPSASAGWKSADLAKADCMHEADLGKPGVFWFRKTVELPDAVVGKPASMRFGTLVDADDCYVNGEPVGSTGYRYPPRNYAIAALPKRMTIAFRLRVNNGVDGGFTPGKWHMIVIDPTVPTDGSGNPLPRADGSIARVWPENGRGAAPKAPIDVIDVGALGPWRWRRSASFAPAPAKVFPTRMPAGCYNAMIAPLRGLALTGVLWYQGETSASRGPAGYAAKMMALIQCWRALFGRPDLPFIYAQLPNLTIQAHGYARLRDEQRRALALDGTAMIVTLDAGEDNDLHPIDKETIGRRFAVAADALVYGGGVESMGPLVSRAEVRRGAGEIVVRFTHCGGGLRTAGGPGAGVIPFELIDPAGESPALAVRGSVSSPHTVTIPLPWGVEPGEDAMLRYAWGESPEPVLRNADGLLASPFEVPLG
ncbi:sialate O-acetylesterase [Bifidobacterium avesanii]|nr:sialate O-acetylesterase [Bifidobacterium avesanii]KAB8289740.1 9-O-acetylesterase [Bifidobacterium avesanii]